MMLLIIGDDFRRKDTAFLLILPRQKKFEKEEDDAGNAGYCGCDCANLGAQSFGVGKKKHPPCYTKEKHGDRNRKKSVHEGHRWIGHIKVYFNFLTRIYPKNKRCKRVKNEETNEIMVHTRTLFGR